MRATVKRKGLGGLALALPIVCCVGFPLIVAAGLSVGVAAVVGGLSVAGLTLVVTLALVALRYRRRRAAACSVPAERVTRERAGAPPPELREVRTIDGGTRSG